VSATGYATRIVVYAAVGVTAGVFVRARRALEEESSLWFESTDDLNCIAGLDGYFVRVNRAFETTLGRPRDEFRRVPFVGFVHPDDVDRTLRETASLREPGYRSVAFRNRYRPRRRLVALARVVRPTDPRSRRDLRVGARRDPAAGARGTLEELARTDQLTGLDNARHFRERVALQLRHLDRYGSGAALLLFDCDGFKAVNDTLGHRAGDDLLEAVARLVRGRVRATDVCARIGGDEFAIFLPEVDEDDAVVVARAIADAVRGHRVEGGPGITISVGIACVRPGFLDVEELVRAADEAMYEAKRAGGDRSSTRSLVGGSSRASEDAVARDGATDPSKVDR
jgi:diguanylate cyclase (GGDEF)-like protein